MKPDSLDFCKVKVFQVLKLLITELKLKLKPGVRRRGDPNSEDLARTKCFILRHYKRSLKLIFWSSDIVLKGGVSIACGMFCIELALSVGYSLHYQVEYSLHYSVEYSLNYTAEYGLHYCVEYILRYSVEYSLNYTAEYGLHYRVAYSLYYTAEYSLFHTAEDSLRSGKEYSLRYRTKYSLHDRTMYSIACTVGRSIA